ncbi:MAG: type II toxin-antitoxin system RelB/DinJ family antitoxin, partial [Christensenellaceae bacterium]|nr:type II toxin-antitoxin system RelB/DinJ family antitoxin [Christensenellaceae bacterium]
MNAQKTSGFYIRMKEADKVAVDKLYRSLGITFTDAVNMFVAKSLAERGLPFELKLPRYNEETIRSFEDGKQIIDDIKNGKRKPYDSTDDAFNALGI